MFKRIMTTVVAAAMRASKSPKGRFYSFGSFPHEVACYGAYLRADWLKELNLEVLETIDEWETVLTAFKEMGIEKAIKIYQDALDRYNS